MVSCFRFVSLYFSLGVSFCSADPGGQSQVFKSGLSRCTSRLVVRCENV